MQVLLGSGVNVFFCALLAEGVCAKLCLSPAGGSTATVNLWLHDRRASLMDTNGSIIRDELEDIFGSFLIWTYLRIKAQFLTKI